MSLVMAEAKQVLTRTPAVLHALLAGLSEPWINATEGPDTWSPRDVVAHLTDLEEQDWMVRVRLILEAGESRPFPPVDRVRFRTTLAGRSVDQLLALFTERRAQNLQALEARRLGPPDLTRRGLHPTLGSVTLAQLLATWVVHDFTHLGQVVRVMARRYEVAVGSWSAYLGILAWRRGGAGGS